MGLQHITTSTIVSGKIRKTAAWDVLCDFESFSKVAPSVIDKVTVHDRTGKQGKSEWFVTIDGAPMTWIERDEFTPDRFSIGFESIYGDFDILKGAWWVRDHRGDGVRLCYKLSYEMGIPILDDTLGDILSEKIRTGMETVLGALGEKVSKCQAEERREERQTVNGLVPVKLGDVEFQGYLSNVSSGGLLVRYDKTTEVSSTDRIIRIGNTTIEPARVENDLVNRCVRVIFSDPMNSFMIDHLLTSVQYRGGNTLDAFVVEESPEIVGEYLR